MSQATALGHARSLLFVPCNRPERFAKAAASGADAIVLDLEDSVPAEHKAATREHLRAQWQALRGTGVPLVVRVNSQGTEYWASDLETIAKLSGLAAVMVPKAESVEALKQVLSRTDGGHVLPLIETAAGLEAVNSLASAPSVLRLVVGHIDFMADTGINCDEHETELAPLRFAIAVATRRSELASAIDGVTVQTDDQQRLRVDTLRAMRFGFGGKLCIHPKQVAWVHAALAPSDADLKWAQRVVEADAASGGAAVRLDGTMVDAPVVLRARRTLARAARTRGESS